MQIRIFEKMALQQAFLVAVLINKVLLIKIVNKLFLKNPNLEIDFLEIILYILAM